MRTVALLSLLLALLTGCGGAPQSAPQPLQTTPSGLLAAQLVHYDRAIAALRATQAVWSDRARAEEIASDRIAADAAFAADTRRLAAIASERTAEAGTEARALQSVERGAGSFAAARARYRSDLTANERAAIAAARRDAQQRIADGVALRREQLDESVATLALQLTRRDASHAMLLQLRATEVGSYAGARHEAAAELAALQASEHARLAALAARNERVLAAYRGSLSTATNAQAERTVARIEQRTQANLAARSAVAAQPPPALIARAVATLRASQTSSFEQAGTTRTAFSTAQNAIRARLAALASADSAAARSLAAEIARLERERRAVYDAIAASSARMRHQTSSALSAVNAPATQ